MARSTKPSIATLYLAFRQAKSALFFEKRGVGSLELALYELDLYKNLVALQAKLTSDRWFDELSIGEVWVVPKRFHTNEDSSDDLHRIGTGSRSAKPVEVQLRISPHPDFAITEVLYIWEFGANLESILSANALGYRLDFRNGQVSHHRRWLFEYWPKRYNEFRNSPLQAARRQVEEKKQTLIISADLASFYDTIDPSFLLDNQLVEKLIANGLTEPATGKYVHATASLIRAYERYYKIAAKRVSVPIKIGVPIGALTSRVIANIALAPLDNYISSKRGVACYRRYVDDLVIVADSENEEGLNEAVRRFLPLQEERRDIFHLDVNLLERPGSEFQLQRRKVRAYQLKGTPGLDFIEAVLSDFSQTVSERRAFIDPSTLIGDGVSHLIRASNSDGSALRVLREADRTRLERFALSTSLRSLERVSSLVDQNEAKDLVRRTLVRVSRVLDSEEAWVDDLDVSLRLLKLAASTEDWKSVKELCRHMDQVWGDTDSIRRSSVELYFKGIPIPKERSAPWIWLRNYLHARRLEALCSSLPLTIGATELLSHLPEGVRFRTRTLNFVGIRRRAQLLASADLRSRDREDDGATPARTSESNQSLRKALFRDRELAERLSTIDLFLARSTELGDRSWDMPTEHLFLCTRPPSYFDIARRWLYSVERHGFTESTFKDLLKVVNAVRGTVYSDPVAKFVNERTVSIGEDKGKPGGAGPVDPRIVLGNWNIENKAWEASATRTAGSNVGNPLLTKERLKGLSDILQKADIVSRSPTSDVLVLPELSLPRSWFRTVANHVARETRHALITGLEYRHHPTQPYVTNQAFAVLPGPFGSVAAWPWTKRSPARGEERELSKLTPPVSFKSPTTPAIPRVVIETGWGAFSVLICSELIEARQISDLLGRAQIVLCPAWNPDTSSFDHLIQSIGFQLHAVIAVANNGAYSDCRAWAPMSERWRRDLCRLVERGENDIVHVDVPLKSLLDFQAGDKQAGRPYSKLEVALKRGDVHGAKRELEKITDELPGRWRPLPPDWP